MDIKYQKNYLTEVIAKIDFLNPINSLEDKFPTNLRSEIKRLFPIAEPQDIIAAEFQIKQSPDSSNIKSNKKNFKNWNFYDKNRNKLLQISYKDMYIVFKVYESFADFKACFMDVTDSLFKELEELQIKRLGLRYTNNIEIPEREPFCWEGYLNKDLLSIFNIPEDKSKIIRAFHNLEVNYEHFNVRFQYGMHNPDYPAPIKKKTFILDYDAYCNGILTKDDIFKNLPIFHEEVQRLFENSISDKLRTRMELNEEK